MWYGIMYFIVVIYLFICVLFICCIVLYCIYIILWYGVMLALFRVLTGGVKGRGGGCRRLTTSACIMYYSCGYLLLCILFVLCNTVTSLTILSNFTWITGSKWLRGKITHNWTNNRTVTVTVTITMRMRKWMLLSFDYSRVELNKIEFLYGHFITR